MEENKDYLKIVCRCGRKGLKTINVKKSIVRTVVQLGGNVPIPLILEGLEDGGGLVGLIEPMQRTFTIRFPIGSLGWKYLDSLYLDMVVNSNNQIIFLLKEKPAEDVG